MSPKEKLEKDFLAQTTSSENFNLLENRSEKLVRTLTFTILFLVLIGLGLLLYTLDYLLQFNPEKIDSFISEKSLDEHKEENFILPTLALSSLANSEQRIRWNRKEKKWTFLDSRGMRMTYDHNFTLIDRRQLERLASQHQIHWDGSKWVLPERFSFQNDESSED